MGIEGLSSLLTENVCHAYLFKTGNSYSNFYYGKIALKPRKKYNT